MLAGDAGADAEEPNQPWTEPVYIGRSHGLSALARSNGNMEWNDDDESRGWTIPKEPWLTFEL